MEFKAVSMPCTEAQWEEIKPVLKSFGIQIEDITNFETDRFLVNNYMSVNNLVTNIPPSDMFKHGRMFFPTYNKEAFLKACGVDYKNALEPKIAEKNSLDKAFQLSKEQIYALNDGTTTVKELFPEVFSEIEVGKWYENVFGSVFMATGEENINKRCVEGFGFTNYGLYLENIDFCTIKAKPANIKKVKALFKTEIEKRYKAGMWIKQPWNENYVCQLAHEPLCFDIFSCFQYAFLGNVCVFFKGQFAEIPTITKQEAENQLKINIE
jgi:hypothetical protein